MSTHRVVIRLVLYVLITRRLGAEVDLMLPKLRLLVGPFALADRSRPRALSGLVLRQKCAKDYSTQHRAFAAVVTAAREKERLPSLELKPISVVVSTDDGLYATCPSSPPSSPRQRFPALSNFPHLRPYSDPSHTKLSSHLPSSRLSSTTSE